MKAATPRSALGYQVLIGPDPIKHPVLGVTAGPLMVSAVINVSDSPALTLRPDILPNVQKHWLPINEASVWPAETIFAFI